MIRTTVALTLILISLCMPLACFAHPCGSPPDTLQTAHGTVAGEPDRCPMQHDLDDCDSTCCCAGCEPLSLPAGIFYTPLVSTLLRSNIHTTLPEILARIFVPPQNPSLTA